MKPALFLMALLLAACGGASNAPAEEMRIALSPAAQPVTPALLDCLPQDDNVNVRVETIFPSQLDFGEYDFYIRLGAPDERPAFAAQIATERVVLAVNAAQTVQALTASQAAELLSGRVENWAQLGGDDEAVLLFAPPQSDEARRALEALLLRVPLSGQAIIATDPQTLLDNVAANNGAAGILPAAWADESVRAIDLDISLPVLAIGAAAPQGAARSVLACLQSAAGQAALAEVYP